MQTNTKDKLEPFFSPSSVVVIGASRNEFTFNWTLIKNLRELRYKGKLYIIHPEATEILGVECHKSLDSLPSKPELAIILLNKNLEEIVEQLIQIGVKYCMIESDPGNTIELKQTLLNLRKLANGNNMYIMGPGMIGVINTQNYFTSSIIPVRRHIIQKHRTSSNHGSMAFFAQSGGLSGALGWWAPLQEIPISKIIHIGKSVNVSEADILQYLFDDPETTVISLYLRDPSNEFLNVLKDNKQKKPVLYKMVGKDPEITSKLENSGAIGVDNYIELFEFAKVFLWSPPPKGGSVGIIGPSSGAIYLLISEMRKTGIHLAKLSETTRKQVLEKVGGSTCLDGNPVDYWPPKKFTGTDVCGVYYISSNALLEDQQVDALFLALEFFTEIEFDFDIFEKIKQKYPDKPIITLLIQAEKEGRERILDCATKLRIPVFVDEVERAIRSYAVLLKYYQMKRESS